MGGLPILDPLLKGAVIRRNFALVNKEDGLMCRKTGQWLVLEQCRI